MKKFTNEIIVNVLKDYKSGKTYKELSNKYKVSIGSILVWVNKSGLKRGIGSKHNWNEIKDLLNK